MSCMSQNGSVDERLIATELYSANVAITFCRNMVGEPVYMYEYCIPFCNILLIFSLCHVLRYVLKDNLFVFFSTSGYI